MASEGFLGETCVQYWRPVWIGGDLPERNECDPMRGVGVDGGVPLGCFHVHERGALPAFHSGGEPPEHDNENHQ